MRLKVVGSGSSGNCYILEDSREALIIEAGLPFMEVKKALNFNVLKIVGVIVSHIHGDHAKYIEEYRKAGIPIMDAYRMCENADWRSITCSMGHFVVKAFPLTHDVPCYGFCILHPEMGNLVYASDTEYIRYRFKGLLNHIIVEANYSTELVDRDEPNYEHRLRGHMSIDTTCRFLRANNNPNLRNVILCHLSSQSADSERFRELAENEVICSVYVAEKGLEVELWQEPF